ncbi:MAG: dihydropteroate synthase [Firmicutes bacterium]|nr:dihydropteroate synthase [Bacillota bacterium]
MNTSSLAAELGRGLILIDGAMGTMLQALGLSVKECPETWNISRPELVKSVHRSYLEAGAQIIETNTFGANQYKLAQFGLADEVEALNWHGVQLARQAIGEAGRDGSAWVAGVIGPLGELLEPYGSLPLQNAYAAFRRQAQSLVEAGADLLYIQTMSDLAEARQAVLAARGLGVPVWCSLSFEAAGRTLTGATPEAAVISLTAAGASVVGANCSLGPQELVPIIERMVSLGLAPVLAEPNAGLPRLVEGKTVFPADPAEFAAGLAKLHASGAAVVGGCCGTTPDHLKAAAHLRGAPVALHPRPQGVLYLASRTEHVAIGANQPVRIIGERINPTGRKKLAADIASGAMVEVAREARRQAEAGAELLDLNVGVAGIDQVAAITQAVPAVERVTGLPLVLDSDTPEVLQAGVSVYQGKALLNSVTAKKESLVQLLPIAKAYGAAVIGLTITEQGIPQTAEERLAAAETIVRTAQEYGLDPGEVIIDCLTLTVGADQQAARETLKAIRLIKQELAVPCVLGISNISHGLPNRVPLNDAFLAMAIANGLDAAIVNPLTDSTRATFVAANLLAGRDQGAARYLAAFGGPEAPSQAPQKEAEPADNRQLLAKHVVTGDREGIALVVEKLLAGGMDPLQLVTEVLTPALEVVGQKYELGEYFLPNLLLSAEAAQKAFAVIKAHFPADERVVLGRALIATVEGDIHDIGKNIVKVILENHGFSMLDLGKDVPVEKIVEVAAAEQVDLVLLSALMTTTLPAMAKTVRRLREVVPQIPVLVGGAVVTAEYAREIGADGYGKDAVAGVQEAKRLLKQVRGLRE